MREATVSSTVPAAYKMRWMEVDLPPLRHTRPSACFRSVADQPGQMSAVRG